MRILRALMHVSLDGFCAGEPWHAVAEARGAGETIVATSQIWPNHPEKVLACRRVFVERHPATARALICTMLEACRWVDAQGHREEIAHWLTKPDALDEKAVTVNKKLQKLQTQSSVRKIYFCNSRMITTNQL